MPNATQSYLINKEYINKLKEFHGGSELVGVEILMAYKLFLEVVYKTDKGMVKDFVGFAKESLDEMEKSFDKR